MLKVATGSASRRTPSNCSQRGFVTKVELNEYGLAGALPSSIGNLIKLTVLNLENNTLEGAPFACVCVAPVQHMCFYS